MSYRVKRVLPIIGMFILISVFVGMVVTGADHKIKQQLPASLDNLETVKLVEIKDAAGQLVLSGNFQTSTEPDGDIEGVAILSATSVDADAKGKAELEVSKNKDGALERELEIELRKLSPATTFSVFVDGQQTATLSTDHQGAVELELSNRATK